MLLGIASETPSGGVQRWTCVCRKALRWLGHLDAALGRVSSLQAMLRREVQNLRPVDVPAASEPCTGHTASLCALPAQQGQNPGQNHSYTLGQGCPSATAETIYLHSGKKRSVTLLTPLTKCSDSDLHPVPLPPTWLFQIWTPHLISKNLLFR